MIEQREENGAMAERDSVRAFPRATGGGSPARTEAGGRAVPPLLPVLLPVVVAAIVTGVLFARWFPPTPPGAEVPAIRFTDVTASAGLGGWSPPVSEEPPTTLGGGVVCFDYDQDGRDDLFFVGGAPWAWEETMAKRISRSSLALFHNEGGGRFREVTAQAGLTLELQGMGAAAGDFDDDGRPDLFVTGVGANHLFRNLGGGRFEDVTERAGLHGSGNTWSTGATWIDIDADGKLDLVIAHYARWSQEVDLRVAFTVASIGHSYGAPTGFIGMFPSVYRNVGDGRFSPVANSAGLREVDALSGFPAAKALAVVPVDANEDGRLDLVFSFHAREDALFLNQGDGTFRRWMAGADRRREGLSASLMASGLLPFAGDAGGDGRFAAWRRSITGSSEADEEGWLALEGKHGGALLDYELDGRLDVFSGGGRAEPDTNRFEGGRAFAAGPRLLWNGGNRWVAVAVTEEAMTARGMAATDFDGDGDLDVVIAQSAGGPRLFRNDQRLGLPWLQVSLIAKRGSRGVHGARVEVHTPRRLHVQLAAPAMSYLGQSSGTLTFGLGDDARVRKVVVHWPGGARQEVRPEGVNQRLTIAEP